MRTFARAALLGLLVIPGAYAQTAIKLSSEVPPITLTAPASLPENPEKTNAAADDYCDQDIVEPASPAAKLVADKHWLVTSEANMGHYRVVSFVGSLMPRMDGNCGATHGRVAVFEKTTLVALAAPADDEKGPAPGKVDERDGDSLIVERLSYGLPVGELHQDAEGIRLTVFSAKQGFCHGTVFVPNVYGMPIRRARTVFATAGWKPVPAPRHSAGAEAVLQTQGVVEANECDETAPYDCSFTYQNAGQTLSVSTIADKKGEPTRGPVNYTSVQCR